jgi:hypothetical protein
LAWGNLVAVSINPAFTNVMQFWFQDAHGNVRGVVYNLSKQQFERTAGLIARR